MKALVTGATGFVGGAVARALIRAGVNVRVLIRSNSDFKNLSDLSVERVEGDLRDPVSLRSALTGCHHLYHVAAHYALWAKDPAIFYEVNVTGTRNMLSAARQAGVERTVYCSTIGAIGLPPEGGLGSEETPVALDQMAGHYKRSKYLAEQEALKFAGWRRRRQAHTDRSSDCRFHERPHARLHRNRNEHCGR
jgi:dihydroflavonol-4-reductase